MDNMTHTLVGIALSRAAFKGRVPYATTAMVLAANAPDVDVAWSYPGIRYLIYHRGFTHSLAALPLWMIGFALVLTPLALRRERRLSLSPRGDRLFRLYALLAFIGVGSHLLLDYSNAYGERLLSPFNEHWLAWDVVPILDPWVWVLLVPMLLAPMVLGLASREMGAKLPSSPHRASAIAALVLLACWWGVRVDLHHRAMGLMGSRLIEGHAPARVAAYPQISTPLDWNGVADMGDRYVLETINGARGEFSRDIPRVVLLKPERSPAIAAAERSPVTRAFLWFARDPLAQVTPSAVNTGAPEPMPATTVFFTDLRFGTAESRRMGVTVVLDRKNRVLSADFAWLQRTPPVLRPGQ
jgi:inner membrane protein